MIKLGSKGILLCEKAGSRLGVGSRSLHFLQAIASFRTLGATGNDEVNTSQGNQATEGYPYLALA